MDGNDRTAIAPRHLLSAGLCRSTPDGDRVSEWRRKADECERAAAGVADPQVQASYRDMASRWHQMADRVEAIQKIFADLRKPGD